MMCSMNSKFNRSNVKVGTVECYLISNTKHQQNNSITLLAPQSMRYEQLNVWLLKGLTQQLWAHMIRFNSLVQMKGTKVLTLAAVDPYSRAFAHTYVSL